jgi:arsenate reductase
VGEQDSSDKRSADRDIQQVLFVCVHNAGRSQMAAALLERYLERLGRGDVRVRSAGSVPASELNPNVVAAMRAVGIDLAGRAPRALEDQEVRESDLIISMGCGQECKVYPGKRYLEWSFPDPQNKPFEEVCLIRDQIDRAVRRLAEEIAGRRLVL